MLATSMSDGLFVLRSLYRDMQAQTAYNLLIVKRKLAPKQPSKIGQVTTLA